MKPGVEGVVWSDQESGDGKGELQELELSGEAQVPEATADVRSW